MTELMFWQSFWFLVIGAAIFLFLWLDGFDLGIGMTLPFLKNNDQRLGALNVIWPTWDGNELYGLIGGGAIYLVLWLYGLLIDKDSQANFVPLNTADDWLHFVLGLGMIALGVALGRRTVARH